MELSDNTHTHRVRTARRACRTATERMRDGQINCEWETRFTQSAFHCIFVFCTCVFGLFFLVCAAFWCAYGMHPPFDQRMLVEFAVHGTLCSKSYWSKDRAHVGGHPKKVIGFGASESQARIIWAAIWNATQHIDGQANGTRAQAISIRDSNSAINGRVEEHT